MVLFVRLGKPLGLDMGIDFGRAYVGVPQEKLHGPQVRAAFQKVGGERMAKGVR